MIQTAVQLYSLRELIKEKGIEAVLGDVAESGFDSVEFAGFYDKTPEEMVRLLDKNGLKGVSAHIGTSLIEQQLPYIEAIGMKHVYIPYGGFIKISDDGEISIPDEEIERIKRLRDIMVKRGITFGYHNHAFEYAHGADAVEYLLNKVDGLTCQLDTFNAKSAGHDAVELVGKYAKRLSSVHIKEMDKRTTDNPLQYPQPVPGEGISGCREAFSAAKKLGVELFVLECESFPCDEKTYLVKSAAVMKEMAKNA